MLRKLLSSALALGLVAGCASAAANKPKKAPGKSGSAIAKSKTRARRSVPRRQTTPTPERYMEIQQALADKGYYAGPINGIWGPGSIQALKRFQQDENLEPDGKLGALSIIALGLGPKRQLVGELSTGTKVEDQQ